MRRPSMAGRSQHRVSLIVGCHFGWRRGRRRALRSAPSGCGWPYTGRSPVQPRPSRIPNRVALMATRQVPGPPGGLVGAGRVRGGLTAMQELAGSTRRICFGSGNAASPRLPVGEALTLDPPVSGCDPQLFWVPHPAARPPHPLLFYEPCRRPSAFVALHPS